LIIRRSCLFALYSHNAFLGGSQLAITCMAAIDCATILGSTQAAPRAHRTLVSDGRLYGVWVLIAD
jgi:hypothetical protein